MTQGNPSTEYRITLCKQEEGGLPVITPYKVGKKTYEKTLERIIKTQGRK